MIDDKIAAAAGAGATPAGSAYGKTAAAAVKSGGESGYQKGVHTLALLASACTLLVIAVGACVTSEIRVMPGSPAAPAEPVSALGALLEQIHLIGALATSALVMILAFLLLFPRGANRDRSGAKLLRQLGGILLGSLVIEALMGIGPVMRAMPGATGILHALLAPIVFSLLVMIAVLTSRGWRPEADSADDGWPASLNTLATLMPFVVLLQITLGAGYRHNSIGVLWHILNAMIVLLVIMIVGVCVLRQFSLHQSLRPAALALVIITGVQVLLGFATFMILLISSAKNMALMIGSVAHVSTGALVLAASVVLLMQARRHLRVVQPALSEDEPEPNPEIS